MSVRRWDGEIVPALRRRLESESSEITRRMSAHNDSATGPLKQFAQANDLSSLALSTPKPKVKESRSRDNFAFVEPLPASLLHEKMPDGTASDDSTEEDTFIQSTNARIKFPKRSRQPGAQAHNVLMKSNIPRRVRPRANTNVSMMHTRHKSNDDEMMEIAKMGHTSYLEDTQGAYDGYEPENVAENTPTTSHGPVTVTQAQQIPQTTNRASGGRSYSSFGMYDNQNKPKKKVKKRAPAKGRASEPYRPPTPETDVDLAPWSVPPPTSTSLPPGKSWDDVVVPTLARKMEMERTREDQVWSSAGSSLSRKAGDGMGRSDGMSRNDIELDTIHDHRVSQLTQHSTEPNQSPLQTPEMLSPHQFTFPRSPSQQSYDNRSNMLRSPVPQQQQQLQQSRQEHERRAEPKSKKKTAKCCTIM